MMSEASVPAAWTSHNATPPEGGIRSEYGSRLAPRTPPDSNRLNSPAIPTYYEQPALKPSFYSWKVSAYIFLGGLAGSAQILATAADLGGGERHSTTVSHGRYLALAGTVLSAPLLIIDLKTPRRFYNMMRIFRPTSPMSIGTYVLLGFGGLSVVLAAAQLRRDLGAPPGLADAAARIVQVPAAGLGALMSTYTGALLASTSTPLWAAAPRILPSLFGASSIGSAAAALSLAASPASLATLSQIERIAGAAEVALLSALRARLRSQGIATRLPVVPLSLAAAAPVLRRGAGAKASAWGRRCAAIAALTGALFLRQAVLRSGNRSATRPRDHFRFARPR